VKCNRENTNKNSVKVRELKELGEVNSENCQTFLARLGIE
jgi:hypothetical protein